MSNCVKCIHIHKIRSRLLNCMKNIDMLRLLWSFKRPREVSVILKILRVLGEIIRNLKRGFRHYKESILTFVSPSSCLQTYILKTIQIHSFQSPQRSTFGCFSINTRKKSIVMLTFGVTY